VTWKTKQTPNHSSSRHNNSVHVPYCHSEALKVKPQGCLAGTIARILGGLRAGECTEG